MSAQADQGQDCHDDNNQADEINNTMHGHFSEWAFMQRGIWPVVPIAALVETSAALKRWLARHRGERTDMPSSDILACDYVDVVLDDGDQVRFVFRPHFPGGAIAPAAFSLEVEGARALSRRLDAILLEKGYKA